MDRSSANDKLREEISEAIRGGSFEEAAALLRAYLREPLTSSRAGYAVSRIEEISQHLDLPEVRIAFARSYTVEPLVPILRARCFAAGLDAEVRVGDFGTHAQDLLDPESPLVEFSPRVVILAVRTHDLLPELWKGPTPRNPRELVDQSLRDVGGWIESFRRASEAHVVIQGFELPPALPRGIHEGQPVSNARDAIWELNRGLRRLAGNRRGVHVLDYAALIERFGRSHWHDERKWLMARLPVSGNHLVHLVDEIMRFVHPLTGRVAKALVVDLDNTLWQGVIGEDGMDGIRMGAELPGAPFRALQEAILSLRERGILLAVCSKNNPADALEVLEKHPDMLLRPRHLSALRINWKDKATNLREIAEQLNIGVDSLAFLDDHHVEREWVRARLPEVWVVECPDDPMKRPEALLGSPVFERVAVSSEDRRRPRFYAEERSRKESEQEAASLEEFYQSLEMRVEPVAPGPLNIARLAQLTQKTNQFNLTTRRHSEQEIQRMLDHSKTRVLAIRVSDRFGDSGIVGVAILVLEGNACEIETFLMSCRVIGRGVETALLSHVTEEAEREGATHLRGWFRPTRKNRPARDFYRDHGFDKVEVVGDDVRWELDLSTHGIGPPPWIEIVAAQEVHSP